jgi:diguanylate cyclase (GGDEF)-like protein
MIRTLATPDASTNIAASGANLAEFRLLLANSLQKSLELHETLATFFQMLHRSVRCCGMEYRMPARDIRLAIGSHRAHKVNYNLHNGNFAVGELTFFRSARFSEKELSTLEELLGLLLLPLRNALLYRDALESSLRDPLTGLGNRANLELTLQRELKLSQRNRRPLSLLIADMDSFKAINDTYGHTVGDQVLQGAARVIKQALRDTDQVFRYGGEEFVVVLANTGNSEAVNIAERIRQQLANIQFQTDIGEIQATISLGVCTNVPEDDRDSLFHRGDQALYEAKRTGRNRVINREAAEIREPAV